MKKAYLLVVLFLCGLSVGNLFASASAAAAAEEAAAPVAGYLGQELIDAAWKGDKPEVEELIERGADVNADDQFGNTALIWAVLRGHEKIVKTLLQVKEIDVNYDLGGFTALMLAAEKGNPDIVKMLLSAGANKENVEAVARARDHNELADMIRDYGSGGLTKSAGKR